MILDSVTRLGKCEVEIVVDGKAHCFSLDTPLEEIKKRIRAEKNAKTYFDCDKFNNFKVLEGTDLDG